MHRRFIRSTGRVADKDPSRALEVVVPRCGRGCAEGILRAENALEEAGHDNDDDDGVVGWFCGDGGVVIVLGQSIPGVGNRGICVWWKCRDYMG